MFHFLLKLPRSYHKTKFSNRSLRSIVSNENDSVLTHLRFVLELTFVTLDHEHTLAEWDDWSAYEISLANKAEGGKHMSNGVFRQSNHGRYFKAQLVLTPQVDYN